MFRVLVFLCHAENPVDGQDSLCGHHGCHPQYNIALEIRFGIWGAFSSSLKCKSQALTANINGAGRFTQTVIQGLGACLFAFLRNFELTLGSMPNDRLVVANHPVLVLSSID